jgi:hypothetical protein
MLRSLLSIQPVFRQLPGKQALNDIAVIPEYYRSRILGGGPTVVHWLKKWHCLKTGPREAIQGAYPEAILTEMEER